MDGDEKEPPRVNFGLSVVFQPIWLQRNILRYNEAHRFLFMGFYSYVLFHLRLIRDLFSITKN